MSFFNCLIFITSLLDTEKSSSTSGGSKIVIVLLLLLLCLFTIKLFTLFYQLSFIQFNLCRNYSSPVPNKDPFSIIHHSPSRLFLKHQTKPKNVQEEGEFEQVNIEGENNKKRTRYLKNFLMKMLKMFTT